MPGTSSTVSREILRPVLIPGAGDHGKTLDLLTVKQSTEILRDFIGSSQLSVMRAGARGEEKEFFISKLSEMARMVATMPKTYEQDGKGNQAIAYLHYFIGACDWYITEKDAETPDEPGQHQAFGLADLGQGFPEIGYISLVEILSCGAELDLHWTPKTLEAIQNPAPTVQPATAAENVIAFPGLDRSKNALSRLLSL